MRLKQAARCAAGVGFTLLLASCAGPSLSYKNTLRSLISAYNYNGAEAEILKLKETEYGKKNAVLFYLDLGMVLHDAGRYAESDQNFDKAETRMEELYTKSVSRALGTLLINDNTTEYAGQPFERALMNVFRSLNYVYSDNLDEALVEARKVTNYLTQLGDSRGYKSAYADDAFAQYLAAMLFEQDARYDDARICAEAAARAYAKYAGAYGTPAPEFSLPKQAYRDSGEIVFLHYNGIAPVKISKTFQVAWNEALLAVRQSGDPQAEDDRFKNALVAGITGNAITVSYPEYRDQPFTISSSELIVDSVPVNTQLMEDVSAIAKGELQEHVASQRIRMIARATIKYVIAQYLSKKVEDKAGEGLGFLAKMVTSGVSAATEVADTRCWATLPAQIRMTRMLVPPGTRNVEVTFRNAAGSVVGSYVFTGVEVRKGQRTYLHYRTAL